MLLTPIPCAEMWSMARKECEVPKKVLIVEDDPDVLGLLVEIFELNGFSVITAPNGVRGLELLTSLEIDLLVTDYDMPIMGGLRLILEYRENDLSLPIVMVTGRVDIDDQEIFRAGASALLEKPFSCSELNSIVESLLR